MYAADRRDKIGARVRQNRSVDVTESERGYDKIGVNFPRGCDRIGAGCDRIGVSMDFR
jgi:hypothetical protein